MPFYDLLGKFLLVHLLAVRELERSVERARAKGLTIGGGSLESRDPNAHASVSASHSGGFLDCGFTLKERESQQAYV